MFRGCFHARDVIPRIAPQGHFRPTSVQGADVRAGAARAGKRSARGPASFQVRWLGNRLRTPIFLTEGCGLGVPGQAGAIRIRVTQTLCHFPVTVAAVALEGGIGTDVTFRTPR